MRILPCLFLLLCATLRADTIVAAPGYLYRVDPDRGIATLISRTATWWDIAFSPSGQLFGSAGTSLYRIDPATGAATLVGGMREFVNGMTFGGDTLYASGDFRLYTLDTATGRPTIVGSTGFRSSGDLEFFGGALYMTASDDAGGSDHLIRVNPRTGRGTLVGPLGFAHVMGLASENGILWGYTSEGDLLAIDVTSGSATRRGSLNIMAWGASTEPAEPVPEPATLFLLGAGLIVAGRFASRATPRRKSCPTLP